MLNYAVDLQSGWRQWNVLRALASRSHRPRPGDREGAGEHEDGRAGAARVDWAGIDGRRRNASAAAEAQLEDRSSHQTGHPNGHHRFGQVDRHSLISALFRRAQTRRAVSALPAPTVAAIWRTLRQLVGAKSLFNLRINVTPATPFYIGHVCVTISSLAIETTLTGEWMDTAVSTSHVTHLIWLAMEQFSKAAPLWFALQLAGLFTLCFTYTIRNHECIHIQILLLLVFLLYTLWSM